ncbi:CHAT domain-containing protein [Bradyrhizobium sp. AUGA SZCCT0169]|uniref:TCAD7 domain-containing protein n=1 Tax=Bradyrhizobium sp. AUGA SZCCT0169 TaxID=2807663 RepID=UPI001BA792AB|nr:TCAD7 domain-containing protein [Bradyrhizobium sp. AUGA SZCCT0169]MBR1247509.1 CHAT domain-containing protein [Bradyrhizobium sp. AUGA SZCCT0169]
MLLETIVFDAAMSVSATRARLARYGLWSDPKQPEARAWIEQTASRLLLSFDETAKRLAVDPKIYGAAIRRQWFASILWYSRPTAGVLEACANANSNETLLNALNLQESDSNEPVPLPPPGPIPADGVVLDGSTPVAVSVPGLQEPPPASEFDTGGGRTTTRGPTTVEARSTRTEILAWPRLDAPAYAPAHVRFDVVVGLSAERQAVVLGEILKIPVPPGATSIDVIVELVADGIDAPDGWMRTLQIDVLNPTAAQAKFVLVGRDPIGPEPVHLTMLEVRYLREGMICGAAARPLVIGRSTDAAPPTPTGFGTLWLDQPAVHAPMTFSKEVLAADLIIEIAKPDRNEGNGRYVCRLSSPHRISIDPGPHFIDLGDDAKTFARSSVVDQVRQHTGGALIENVLEAVGSLVAEKLPAAVFDALRELAKRFSLDPPSVLISSAEPFVPWELALMDPPLDASRPSYLGAQTVLGRWLRDHAGSTPPTIIDGSAIIRIEKPPAQPPGSIDVRDMAVMAGFYKAESGLKRLPAAEDEAAKLVANYDAIPLAASAQALSQLLGKKLEHSFRQIGGVGAVHFAGHGEFNPTLPDSSVLFLSDGHPLSSLVFRSAKYGGAEQPLLFLNACMIGIGGTLLGDMGGFPGNCLRGGFGGILGALWEVDDVVAAKVALEFWRRALPLDGTDGEPVGRILRDLRANFSGNGTTGPIPTCLSYVYYGHPLLRLRRQIA